MALREVVNNVYEILKKGDPRMEYFPFMGSPFPVVIILISYILFVFKLGPEMMRGKEPYNLKKTIRNYNLAQIVFNALGVLSGIILFPRMSIYCIPLDHSMSTYALSMLSLHYGYFLLKVLDLLDTVFFVLRKKYNQITFLHVYHHITMIVGTWISGKFFPGGQLYFLGFVNTFVHVVMYFYYFLTCWDDKYKGSLWWKKHLTQLQIVQHCFIFISFLIPLLNEECTYPKFLLAGFLPAVAVMIYLFTDFYIKAYVKKKVPKKE